MTSTRRDGGFRHAPRGLLGMIVLVWLVEAFVARHEIEFTGSWACQWRRTAWVAKHAVADRPILAFGDSLVEYGVVPRVIEARLGKRSYNLALAAGAPAASYLLFRQALDSGAKPEAVLVNFAPHTLAQALPEKVPLWREVATLRDALDLAWTQQSATLFGQIALARLFTTLKARDEIRASVRDVLGGGLNGREGRRSLIALFMRSWRINQGAHLVAKGSTIERGSDQVTPMFEWLAYPQFWYCWPENVRYVERFFNLAAARGIRVYWLIPPYVNEVHDRRESLGFETQYTRFVEQIQERCPNVAVIDARRSGYDWPAHIDPFHLDRQGAIAFSTEVADQIGRSLDPSSRGRRWANLPRYRARPEEGLAEDLDQTLSALAAGAAARTVK